MKYTYKYADMSTQEIGQSFHEDIESALHRYYDPSPDPGKISPDFYDIAPDASCISNAAKVLRSILDTMDDMDAALRSRPAHTFADIIC